VKEVRQDRAQWNEIWYYVKPGEGRGDMISSIHGNESGDAGRTFGSYLISGGTLNVWADAKLTDMAKKANTLPMGPERQKAFQEAFSYVYGQVPIIPIVHPKFIFGMAKNLDWTPRMDTALRVNEMKLGN